MSNIQEIKNKISNIKKMKKITKAMEMISANKMKKLENKMKQSISYIDRMYKIIKNISYSNSEYKHICFLSKEEKNIGFIIITTNRGLCGNLNNNLFREITKKIYKCINKKNKIYLYIIGKKGESFFKRIGMKIYFVCNTIEDQAKINDIIYIADLLKNDFYHKKIDSIYIAYNIFINTLIKRPTIKKLLPFPINEQDKKNRNTWDYIYEPNAKELLDDFVDHYIKMVLYHSIIENLVCEQSSKMIAMKNATDNATDLIEDFKLFYNKSRQFYITKELSEIVSNY